MPSSWTVRYLVPSLLISTTLCARSEHQDPVQRRQNRGVVTGVETRDEYGNFHVRREVRDLHKNYPDQWNLYLLALEKLHWVSQDDPYSYFAIASIHGRPFRVWEGAPGLAHKVGSTGYCPHNNPLFLTWHRPYLALFEQVVHQHMLDVAWTAPPEEVDRYVAAANAWRSPYWDWANGDSTVPWFFMTEKISVLEPGDTKKTVIWNPLYTFRFQEVPGDEFDDKFRFVDHTVRWPNSSDPSAASNQASMQAAFTEQAAALVTAIGTAFRSSTFNVFSGRVEEPHGWMHGVIGGNWDKPRAVQGHFWPLEYAGFDPIFMLHHTNVDRLTALYQAVNPDRWLEPISVGPQGNVFIEDYETIDANTLLIPFRKSSGEFWTSNDGRDHTVFGYTYPELQPWNYESEYEYLDAVTGYVSQTYGAEVRIQVATSQQADAGDQLLSNKHNFIDWTIDAFVLAAAVPHTFVVHFFFGSGADGVHVGTWIKLMPKHNQKDVQHGPSHRRASSQHKFNGTVNLTTQLIRKIGKGLASLDPRDVVPFLKSELKWKVRTGDGQLLGAEQIPAFSFEVLSGNAYIPDDDRKPVQYEEDLKAHPDIVLGII